MDRLLTELLTEPCRIKWLKNKGYDYRDAVDGLDGVRVFQTDGHFEYAVQPCCSFSLLWLTVSTLYSVVLVDLSMPVLDGKPSQRPAHP